jgi:hypothetical protein
MIFLIDKSGSICYKSVTLEKMGSEAEAEHRHRAGRCIHCRAVLTSSVAISAVAKVVSLRVNIAFERQARRQRASWTTL